MLKMGLPIGAVKNALTKDGKDPLIMDLNPKKTLKSQMGGDGAASDNGPPLKDDPDYAKYFKMLSMFSWTRSCWDFCSSNQRRVAIWTRPGWLWL